MNRTIKISLVAGVLFGGIALALFFKKDPTDEPIAAGDPASQNAPADVELPDLTPREQPAENRLSGDSPSPNDQAGGGLANRWGKDAPVPQVSPSFQPSTQQPASSHGTPEDGTSLQGTPSRWIGSVEQDPFSDRPAPRAQASGSPRTALKYHFDDSAAAAQPARVHKIADGDTLRSLAVRYYDDATASTGIFEANRGVLSDPDLLPIGRQLRIPVRTSVPTKPAAAKTAQKQEDDEELVPVGSSAAR